MDADGFKVFPLHSATTFPMHLIADAPSRIQVSIEGGGIGGFNPADDATEGLETAQSPGPS
jgi:hypothetical protein